MNWIDIVWEITKLLVGYGTGVITAVWLLDKESLEAFDTGYEIGYAKGAEEEQQKKKYYYKKMTSDGIYAKYEVFAEDLEDE